MVLYVSNQQFEHINHYIPYLLLSIIPQFLTHIKVQLTHIIMRNIKMYFILLLLIILMITSSSTCFLPVQNGNRSRQTRLPQLHTHQHQLEPSRRQKFVHNNLNISSDSIQYRGSMSFADVSKKFCALSPLWTILAAVFAMQNPSFIGSTISLSVMQSALGILMLSMGLSITPSDILRAIQKPYIILLNILLCFGMMPMLSTFIASLLHLSPDYKIGLILLGCVSGGQASNLFALLAGGDVALSVACTLSTTLLGIVAIPILVERMLSTVVVVDSIGVLQSVAQLVLGPLLLGLVIGTIKPSLTEKLQSFFPVVGVLATLILVCGGASNCSNIMSSGNNLLLASYLLPVLGGFMAWIVSFLKPSMAESSRRTLVVETLSKSPTLAYVLAQKHFAETSALIPAASMVSLAIVGAAVASVWQALDPIEKYPVCRN